MVQFHVGLDKFGATRIVSLYTLNFCLSNDRVGAFHDNSLHQLAHYSAIHDVF